jgi:hypothetical protein
MQCETAAHGWTYRRDRSAELRHIVPASELGARGRALCGSRRQGTRLSEEYALLEPSPPERLCPGCTERAPGFGIATRGDA